MAPQAGRIVSDQRSGHRRQLDGFGIDWRIAQLTAQLSNLDEWLIWMLPQCSYRRKQAQAAGRPGRYRNLPPRWCLLVEQVQHDGHQHQPC